MPVWIASVFIVTVMKAPTARTKKKIAAEPYSRPDCHGPTNPFEASTPYSPFGGAFQSVLKRYVNDVSTQLAPGTGVAPGADTASAGATPDSPGDSTMSASPPASTAEHEGSS